MSEQETEQVEQTKKCGQKEPEAQPAESAAGEEKPALSLENELEQARQELARTRKEAETSARRLDEVTRAYSSLLNDQKDFRNRLEREKERALEGERGKIALHLLQVGDEVERALAAVPAADEANALVQGVKLIHEGLGRTIASLGIERLSLVGKPFDPNQAEAIDVVVVQDPALDSQVMAEAMAGYRQGERILRPAKVRVARHVPSPAPTTAEVAGAPE